MAMRIFRNINPISPPYAGCVATIGNFDGMHLGHQALLTELKNKAKTAGLPACVVLFEPQPKEYFLGEKAPARLMHVRDKWDYLQNYGIDQVLCLPFNARMAAMSAEDFIRKLLAECLQVKHLIIGPDFHFGHQRQGDVTLLQQKGISQGYQVTAVAPKLYDQQCVSSTAIRGLLAKGDLAGAQELLGHPFVLSGRIGKGQGLGRGLGYPTANILLKRQILPVSGVFAAKVIALHGQDYAAAVSVGHRPAVGGGEGVLEAFLLDFDGDLYGQRLHVVLHKFLREQWDFPDMAALTTQIAHDVEQARSYFTEKE
jgi:riboflavin kinase / FMN adenylyltransferase